MDMNDVKDFGKDVKETMSDTLITGKVKAALMANDQIKSLNISVETNDDGVVTLTGTVANDSLASLAEGIAKGVDGVKSVTNNLSYNN